MRGSRKSEMTAGILLAAGWIFAGCAGVAAQQNTPPRPPAQNSPAANKKAADDIRDADVLIIANVTARELKVEIVPNPKVEFPGTHERKNVWESDRQNLPASVEPGVTYRNIGIQLRIASRFADIERIVAEALGEIPVSDDSPAKQPAAAPPAQEPPPPPPPTSRASLSERKKAAPRRTAKRHR